MSSFGTAAVLQTEDPNAIKIRMKVEPWDTAYCCLPMIRPRWYTYIRENSIEQNRPCFCPPFCCMQSCIFDNVTVNYVDRSPFTPSCFGMCPGKFVSAYETMYILYCIPTKCCYDLFCKCILGESVVRVPCDNKICKRCGCACPYLTCIKDSEKIALELEKSRERAKGGATVVPTAERMEAN
eukprot:CAMPEP_0177698852 /NCGR_PEP_ID=MMETSP0484_2-20121128/5266_1 /TAXON_ID=354590 /ORGANISM="Rhodomonas lens, Strain RHODO" /LENGTH=181 /DNA_ID=CAMNT_0019209981 /DNA_START=65 /DNA_END=610 /DNA_ORIENTATION=-